MGLFDGCLLASDLDGTLVYGDSVPERNIELIKYFTDEGGIFSVATGRSNKAVDCVLKDINGIGPSVFTNGSLIYDYSKKEILHQFFIDKTCNSAIETAIKLYPDIGIEVHSGGKVYIAQNNDIMQIHTDYEQIDVINTTVSDVLNMPLNKILYVPTLQESVPELTQYFKSQNLNCDFVNSSATMFGDFYIMLEQLPKNITKADGLEFLLDKFSVPKSNFFAIGDFYNDIAMIKSAGIGAATLESPDEVKTCADYLTGSAKDGAVADFIEYLIKVKTKKGN